MPKSARLDPLGEVTFHCKYCARSFSAAPSRVDAFSEREHHPHRYFGTCPTCKDECEQAQWEQALLKAWASATGPRTPEGKAATARNLKGHPTAEEAQRTRFNAMKHGMHAHTATYFPAKPDGYSFCSSCEVDRTWCGRQPACVKKTELFMLHQAAFEQRDPKVLHGLYANLHAAVFAVLQQILQTIIADGVTITAPEYYTTAGGIVLLATYRDKDGNDQTIKNLESHPLFRPLADLLSRTGLTLTDMGMTTKVIEQADDEGLGQLQPGAGGKETPASFKERATRALEDLSAKVERANKRTAEDPVLLEYNKETGTHVPVER